MPQKPKTPSDSQRLEDIATPELVAMLDDATLCQIIVERCTNPPATTAEALRVSLADRRRRFGDEEGRRNWREFTEKLALVHLDVPGAWPRDEPIVRRAAKARPSPTPDAT